MLLDELYGSRGHAMSSQGGWTRERKKPGGREREIEKELKWP